VRAEVERLLACIAEGADHYRVLDISREAPVDDVRLAYCKAVEQLHPLKCQDLIEGDGVLRWKLSDVFLRIVEAFSVLSSPGRKVEYDGLLNLRPIKPLPMPHLPGFHSQSDAVAFADSNPDGDNGSKRFGLGSAFGYAELNAPKVADRRAAARLALRLPVRVRSNNNDWQEVTETWTSAAAV
jgi:DnaJ-class molecular chaperone